MYKLVKHTFMNQESITIVKTNADGSESSFGEWADNTDYQAFLRWCEEGNTPLPAEEQA